LTRTVQTFGSYSNGERFFGNASPFDLAGEYGTPLYAYNESVLRRRCREMLSLVKRKPFIVSYSAKANSNLELLKIIRDEGLRADAMSPGEIHLNLLAGFDPSEIFFVCNNVSSEEMQFAIDRGVLVSVDSLSQLRRFGELSSGGRVAVRFNPGVGAGHHAKVVTAGKNTKFAVSMDDIDEVAAIAREFDLTVCAVNQHIGSLFLEGTAYLSAARALLEVAARFLDVELVDFGGGFGVPYRKLDNQARLDLDALGAELTGLVDEWCRTNGRKIACAIEPGRYITAECGILLGTVHAVKQLSGVKYAGTDIGFNVLVRPAMYDAHHDLLVYRKGGPDFGAEAPVTVVGNICETGDILAKERYLPTLAEGDLIGVLDAGAYGYSMCSQYNLRLRPAEVLIDTHGN
jgi:diaminopimelate decarboxylase